MMRRWGDLHASRWANGMFVAAALMLTGCAGFIGAGAAVAFVGAGVLAFTCYDRVNVTVTDRVTGTKLCDAKVSFFQGSSETVASSCYQAALSAGSYKMRVERRGLATFEEPVEVVKSHDCGQSIQTMYVALDRLNRAAPPQQVVAPPPAPAPATSASPPPAPAPSSAPAPAAPSPPLPAAPPAPPGTPPSSPAPGTTPAPAMTVFPDAP